MDEHTFDTQFGEEFRRGGAVDETGFDFGLTVDSLRTHTTDWLRGSRAWLVREQRRLSTLELAVTRVLDERGAYDDSLAAEDGVSVQTVRDKAATARELEHLPEMAAAAYDGRISEQQVVPAAKVASPATDGEWATRAAATPPGALEREVAKQRAMTAEEMAARRDRRSFRWWRTKDDDRLVAVHGEFYDIEGVLVEKVLDQMMKQSRPGRREEWADRDRRGADVFLDLCSNYADAHVTEFPEPLFVYVMRPGEPVTIAGIPMPDSFVEALLPNAKVEVVTEDAPGALVSATRSRAVLPRRIRRSILRRDARCRYPGCERRLSLQIHHLLPVSWGGTDDLSNLASVCVEHHRQLAPHGQWLLLGNPNRPDGLRLVRVDDLPDLAARAGPDHDGGSGIRAGPEAA